MRATPPIIKPRDLVRLRDASTGHCTEILPGNRRKVVLLDGKVLELPADELYLVRSAEPRPWKKRGVPA